MTEKMKTSFAVLLSMVFLTSCSILIPVEDEAIPPPILRSYDALNQTVYAVGRGDIQKFKDITLTFEPLMERRYVFQVAGEFITSINVKTGDLVKPGDILGELDTRKQKQTVNEAELSLQRAELKLRQLRENYDIAARIDKLAGGTGYISSYEKQINDLTLQISNSVKELEKANNEINARRLISDIDGRVTYSKPFEIGELSDSLSTRVTVSDDSTRVFVAGGDNAKILTEGMQVKITVNNIEYDAEVINKAEASRYRKVNDDEAFVRIKDEGVTFTSTVFGKIRLVFEEALNVIVIPSAAVIYGADFNYVNIMVDGVKTYRIIELGIESGGLVEVKAGLAVDDQIVHGGM